MGREFLGSPIVRIPELSLLGSSLTPGGTKNEGKPRSTARKEEKNGEVKVKGRTAAEEGAQSNHLCLFYSNIHKYSDLQKVNWGNMSNKGTSFVRIV